MTRKIIHDLEEVNKNRKHARTQKTDYPRFVEVNCGKSTNDSLKNEKGKRKRSRESTCDGLGYERANDLLGSHECDEHTC